MVQLWLIGHIRPLCQMIDVHWTMSVSYRSLVTKRDRYETIVHDTMNVL